MKIMIVLVAKLNNGFIKRGYKAEYKIYSKEITIDNVLYMKP